MWFDLSIGHWTTVKRLVCVLVGTLCVISGVVGMSVNDAALLRGNVSSSGLPTPGTGTSFPAADPSPWHFCFEDKCRCRGEEADCSQNHGRLPFIPRLPEGIRYLNFSSNSLTTIPRDFFINVTGISFLDLCDNDLTLIHPGAFVILRNISGLVLRHNIQLTYVRLHAVFSIPTLEYLDISGINLGKLPSHFFHIYNFTRLRRLEMSGNQLISGDLTAFAQIENLESLGLALNDIPHVMTRTVLKLETIDLGHNLLSVFPDSCKNNVSLFPNLQALILQHNTISTIPSMLCLPQLQFLDLSQNTFSAVLTNSFTTTRFPNLLTLDLGSMRNRFYIEQDAFNNKGLDTLSLANNFLYTSIDDSVDPHSFRGCSNLSTLIMKNNGIGQTSKRKLQLLFGVLPRLHVLDLSCGDMEKIPSFTSSTFPQLQQLSLRDNMIESLPDGFMNVTANLTVLDLSHNLISQVLESTFNKTTRYRLHHLDLSGNRFVCSCKLMWFRQWFVSQPSLFDKSQDNYTCTYAILSHFGSGTIPLESFFLAKQACLLDPSDYESLSSYAFILVFIPTLYIIVKFVKKVLKRPLLIRAFRGRENGIRFAADDDYLYDIFVVYAHGDSEWVCHHLIPELEGRLRLRLCLHQRDFHPGRNVLDNIEDSVEKSKRTMMIFSSHFARSLWCQFELALCQRQALDNEDVMVVVCLEEVQPREWTSGMMAILRTSTYIRWSEDPRDRVRFWGAVVTALLDVLRPDVPPA